MTRFLCVCMLTSLLYEFCGVVGVMAQSVSLENELHQLEGLRQGRKTPLGLVDTRGYQLLERFRTPREQGQIYYRLAHIYAQSGLTQPGKMREYAQQALKYSLDPSQKLILCVYMGDALQVEDPRSPFPAKRAKAVVPYLEGLKEAQSQHLPAKPPESPPVGASDIPPSDPGYAEYKRQHDEALHAWEIAQVQKKLIGLHDVLVKQIVGLYTRSPFATEELKGLATDILGEGEELDRLITTVNDKVAKLSPGDRNNLPPAEAAIRSKYLYLGLMIVGGAIPAIVLLLLARRRRVSREAGAKSAR